MILPNQRPIDLNCTLKVGPDEPSVNRLCAAMVFPDDPESQTRYLQEMALPDYLFQAGRGTPIKRPYFADPVVEGTNNGVLAGLCLMYFHLLSGTGIKTNTGKTLEVSQRIVLYLCQTYNMGREDKSKSDEETYGKYPTVSPPQARKNWKRYQRVAHLWAAYVTLKRLPIRPVPTEHVLAAVDISVFLFLARQYERFVTEFFDGKKSEPTEGGAKAVPREKIVPLQVRYCDWNFDDVLQVEIPKLDQVSDWVFETVKSYIPE